ncbi:MAG: polysaccharide pyruvyl transferase family protein [Alphaproteobacteria bacterium]
MTFVNELVLSGAFTAAKIEKLISRNGDIFVIPPATVGSMGDEAMYAGLKQICSERFPGFKVRQCNFSDMKPLKSDDEGSTSLSFSLEDTSSRIAFIQNLRRCRHLTVLGADVMDGFYSALLVERIVEVCNTAIRAGTSASILGFSFSSMPSDRAVEALRLLNKNVDCCCRDTLSLQRFEEAARRKARLVADLAFYCKGNVRSPTALEAATWVQRQRKRGFRVIGFNANPLIEKSLGVDLLDRYVESVHTVLAENPALACVFLPHDVRGDISDVSLLSSISNRLPAELRQRVHLLQPEFDEADIKGLAAKLDLLVSGRMHLAIAGLSQGVPTLGLSYQGKF